MEVKKIFAELAELIKQEKYKEAHGVIAKNFFALVEEDANLLADLHIRLITKGEMFELDNPNDSASCPQVEEDEGLEELISNNGKPFKTAMEKSVEAAFREDGEFKKKLNSKDMMQIMVAIRQIHEKEDLGLYLEDINGILMDETFPGPQKSLVLATLQSCNFDQKVTMIRYGEYFEYIPTDLPSLEPENGFNNEVDKIIKIKNVTVIEFTKQIIRMYELGNYPNTIPLDEHHKYLILVSSYIMACGLFKEPTELKDELMKKYNLTLEEIKETRKDIEFKTSHEIV